MKVFELLYLFNKHLTTSILKYPKTGIYIISAYSKVSKKITELYDNNKSITNADIKELNITDYMKNKLCVLLTKKINPCEIKQLKKKQLIDELINLAGIGKFKANSLIKSGLTTISDLKKKKYKDQLNDATILLMKYKPIRKIPYMNIKKLESSLTGFPNSRLVGGFRRKKQFSKDIDVMIVGDKKTVLDNYLKYLEKKFTEIHTYSKGNDKLSLIALVNLSEKNSPKKKEYYKIDVFRSSVSSKYAMLLYSTGSKDFNIKMRRIASKMGYILNQNGLYKKGSKTPINVKSEIDFFNKLNMDYTEPTKR
jgi:DNA polymerase/3'-5' exonuclease PolX